jgi:hypothetical protein
MLNLYGANRTPPLIDRLQTAQVQLTIAFLQDPLFDTVRVAKEG